MNMGELISILAYLLMFVLNVAALLLILEWLVHLLPGSGWNRARRFFFQLSYPFFRYGTDYFPFRLGNLEFRGLLIAFFLLALSRFGMPWLVLLGYNLRG